MTATHHAPEKARGILDLARPALLLLTFVLLGAYVIGSSDPSAAALTAGAVSALLVGAVATITGSLIVEPSRPPTSEGLSGITVPTGFIEGASGSGKSSAFAEAGSRRQKRRWIHRE